MSVDQSNIEPECGSGDVSAAANMAPIVPVVLSGGGGTRLWPFSTNETPKQFLPIFEDGATLFGQALDRVRDRQRFRSPIIVASIHHASTCKKELSGRCEDWRLILEPVARNTAPAILLAAIAVAEIHGPDSLMLVTPSDHVIEDVAEFYQAVVKGEKAARLGKLVTFGVRPSNAETGYGYIEMGGAVGNLEGVASVARFVEKPRAELAEAMVADGNHLWNAGIFLFSAAAILKEAQLAAPAIVAAVEEAYAAADRKDRQIVPDSKIFSDCPSESIDNAVMERSRELAVVPMSPGWSDLGSWDAFVSMLGTDSYVGPVTTLDCESCYIRSDGLEVAALGVRDLIIVASGRRLLILPRGRSQEVKQLLSAMDSVAA